MDIALALHILVPNADYSGAIPDQTEAVYDNLSWYDPRPKPTWQQLVAAWGEFELDQVINNKLIEIQTYSDNYCATHGAPYDGRRFQIRKGEEDQANFTARYLRADRAIRGVSTWPFTVHKWFDKDNNEYLVDTPEKMIALGDAVDDFKTACFNATVAHQTAVIAIKNDEELTIEQKKANVETYNFTAGWPA